MQMNQMLIEQSRSEGIQEVYNSMGMPDLGKQMANTLMHTQKLKKIDIGDSMG
jgi:NAD-dependent DNA ligase